MICKVCNATIDDNAQACPFCGTLTNVSVDPGTSAFPDPAVGSQGTVNLSKPEAPSADDLGLSEPAQYTDPAANQNPQQPYANNAPTGQPVQPGYGQNSYDQSYSQPNYNQNAYGGGYNSFSPEMEKEAQTIMTLGIVALVVGFLCCAPVGPICGGIGISKYSKLSMDSLSEDAKKKANTGRILCIIGCVLGALSMVIGGILGGTGAASNLNQ